VTLGIPGSESWLPRLIYPRDLFIPVTYFRERPVSACQCPWRCNRGSGGPGAPILPNGIHPHRTTQSANALAARPGVPVALFPTARTHKQTRARDRTIPSSGDGGRGCRRGRRAAKALLPKAERPG